MHSDKTTAMIFLAACIAPGRVAIQIRSELLEEFPLERDNAISCRAKGTRLTFNVASLGTMLRYVRDRGALLVPENLRVCIRNYYLLSRYPVEALCPFKFVYISSSSNACGAIGT